MGLGLSMAQAAKGIRNVRFVLNTVVWCFLFGPLLAFGIINVLPIAAPEGLGLILLGVSPCAPFLPMLLKSAQGDKAYTAAFMLIAALGTVVLMPFEVPLFDPSLSVSSWALAKPLLAISLLPLVVGMTLYNYRPVRSSKIQPVVKKVNVVFAVFTLGLSWVVYGQDLLTLSLSSWGAEVLFFMLLSIGSYVGAASLEPNQRIVLTVGSATRNLGVAIAPLVSLPVIDQRTIAMIVLAAPIMILVAIGSTKIYRILHSGGISLTR